METPQNCPFLLTCCVTLTTVYTLPCDTVRIVQACNIQTCSNRPVKQSLYYITMQCSHAVGVVDIVFPSGNDWSIRMGLWAANWTLDQRAGNTVNFRRDSWWNCERQPISTVLTQSKCFECLNNNEPHLLNDRQLQCVMDCYNYTMCQNVPNLASCSFIKHKLILIIFSK